MPPRKRRLTAAEKRAKEEASARRARSMFAARMSARPPEPEFEMFDVDAMESELIQQTARELHRMGKLHSMLGAQALVIARQIVRGEGASLATLSKEHSRLMAAIAAGQDVTPTPEGTVSTSGDALDAAERSAEEKRRRAAQAGGVS